VLTILISNGVKHYALSIDVPLFGARPSIGVFFESVADFFGPEALGILLTGGGVNGLEGLGAIKTQGGKTIVQDPATAISPELPQAAIAAGLADQIVDLNNIALELLKLTSIK
jgi:two-component system chemotaxis response regulator CheB